jgi:curved DNA-binding protein CbpA
MDNLGAFAQRPPPPVGAVVEAPAAPAPVEAGPIKGDDQALASQIEARFADVQAKKDHFTLLGLQRDASATQVKAAFLSLAKVFHPDRLPPSLSQLSTKITTVFEAVREAYDTLYDDAKRNTYRATLERAAISAAPLKGERATKEADELSKKAEVLFKKRDYKAAEDHFNDAYKLDPKAVHLAAAAWALYMDPARKNDAPRARQMMADALKADPNCDRAHYQLGVIARVEGDMDRAERLFRDAVRANPKHLEANQELRLIEMRKKKDGKKGFFR